MLQASSKPCKVKEELLIGNCVVYGERGREPAITPARVQRDELSTTTIAPFIILTLRSDIDRLYG